MSQFFKKLFKFGKVSVMIIDECDILFCVLFCFLMCYICYIMQDESDDDRSSNSSYTYTPEINARDGPEFECEWR